MNKKSIAIGTLLLFIISSMTPLTVGINIEKNIVDYELEEIFKNFQNNCMTPDGFSEKKEIPLSSNTYSSQGFAGGLMNSAWPMFGHDTKHTGRSPYSTEENSGVKLWDFQTENFGIDSSPAIDCDGIIYFGSNEGYLHAFYPNGTEKWRADCDDWISSSPAIAEDGTIYVGSWDDHLYAINPDGTRKWRFYADDILGSPVIGEDGIIYFGALGPGTNNGRAYALYPNGTEKWHFDTGFWIYRSLAIGDDGIIYVPSDDNRIYALYPNNGTCKWSYGLSGAPGSPSIGDDGTIYVPSTVGYLFSLYPNGTLRWTHGIDWGSVKTPTIGNDGTIYIGNKYLYAINSNGTRKWTFNCGESQNVKTSCSISSEGTIYFGTSISTGAGGYIIAVNSDGTEKWREWIHNERCHSTPAIAKDGTVYIGTSWNDFGIFYAFGGGNRPPEKPIITGDLEGKVSESYDYSFVSTDYEESELWYYIAWGDEHIEEWIGPYDSGVEVEVSHTWSRRDTYTIQAKVKDSYGSESDWSELKVTMLKTRLTLDSILLEFLDMFPILQKLLDFII